MPTVGARGFLLGVAVLTVAGVVVGYLVWKPAAPPQPPAVPVAPAAPSPPPSAKPMVAPLTEEQREAEHARLRELIREALRTLASARPETPADNEAPVSPAEAAWLRGLDEMTQAGGGFDARLALAQKMARLGRNGVACLKKVAQDHGRDLAERDAAVRVLSLIRSRDALEAVLELREPDAMELDYPYDLVMLQVASLSTSAVRDLVPQLVSQIGGELGSDTLAPERPELLAILALAHGDRAAQALLYDERILRENLAGAVSAANDLHTPAAREFLDWLAQQGAGASVNELGQILNEW